MIIIESQGSSRSETNVLTSVYPNFFSKTGDKHRSYQLWKSLPENGKGLTQLHRIKE